MHSTAGGAKPRLGVGGGGRKAGEREVIYRTVETRDAERIGGQARGQMVKQEQRFAHITRRRDDLKSHLNCRFKRPISQTTV